MWCLWCCKQVLCLWPEHNGFRWVNDPSNLYVYRAYVTNVIMGQPLGTITLPLRGNK